MPNELEGGNNTTGGDANQIPEIGGKAGGDSQGDNLDAFRMPDPPENLTQDNDQTSQIEQAENAEEGAVSQVNDSTKDVAKKDSGEVVNRFDESKPGGDNVKEMQDIQKKISDRANESDKAVNNKVSAWNRNSLGTQFGDTLAELKSFYKGAPIENKLGTLK